MIYFAMQYLVVFVYCLLKIKLKVCQQKLVKC